MAKDYEVRIFLTLQSDMKIEDITPEVVNEYMRNKPSMRLETWKEMKNGKLRTRSRWYSSKPSSRKNDVAQKMGEIGELRGDVRVANTREDIKTIKRRLGRYSSEFPLSKRNLGLFNNSISRRETVIDNIELRRSRATELVGLSKIELSQRGISARTTVKSFAKRFDLSQDNAAKILEDLNI